LSAIVGHGEMQQAIMIAGVDRGAGGMYLFRDRGIEQGERRQRRSARGARLGYKGARPIAPCQRIACHRP